MKPKCTYPAEQTVSPLPINKGGYQPSNRTAPTPPPVNKAKVADTSGALNTGATKQYVTRPNSFRNGAS